MTLPFCLFGTNSAPSPVKGAPAGEAFTLDQMVQWKSGRADCRHLCRTAPVPSYQGYTAISCVPCPKGIPHRGAYYNHYTGKKWGDSRNYHMTLDSGALGYDMCVKIITEAAQAEV